MDKEIVKPQSMDDSIDLKSFVGGILLALQEAKHLGDLESIRLGEAYKQEKALSALMAPAYTIADVDVELRFAIVGLSKEEQKDTGLQGLKVSVTASSLEGIDPSQIQTLKLKIVPVPLRVFEEDKGG